MQSNINHYLIHWVPRWWIEEASSDMWVSHKYLISSPRPTVVHDHSQMCSHEIETDANDKNLCLASIGHQKWRSLMGIINLGTHLECWTQMKTLILGRASGCKIEAIILLYDWWFFFHGGGTPIIFWSSLVPAYVRRNAPVCGGGCEQTFVWRRANTPDLQICLQFSVWNVGTLSGKSQEMSETLKRSWIYSYCLQKVSWK